MSDANRMNLAYALEATYGVFPPTGVLTDVRMTGESISQVTGTVNSAEIRADRQITDHIRTTINVAGDINIELSYGAFDDFLSMALMDNTADFGWEAAVTNSSDDLSVDDADNSFNSVGATFVTDGYDANRWIKAAGFSTAANNGFFRIVSVAAGKIIVTGGTLVTEIAGTGKTLTQGELIKNGTSIESVTFEKEYQDVASEFARYVGCMVDTFTFTVPSDNIVTGTFGFLGKIETSQTASTVGDSTATAPANEVMAGIEDITAIMENNAAFASTQFSVTISNNLRQRLQIGTLGPISIGTGTIDVTGTLQAYFASKAIIDKYLNFTDTSLAIQFADSTGKGYVIDLPRVNYDQGNRVAGGVNTDILADMTFSAFRNSAQNETITIQRFAA